jgi:hypothetical protein
MTSHEQLSAARAACRIVTILAEEQAPGDAVRAIGTVERDELEGRLLWIRPWQTAIAEVLVRLPELNRVVSADVVFGEGHRPTQEQLVAVWGEPETVRPDDGGYPALLFTVTAGGRRVYVRLREPEAETTVDRLLVVLP